MLPRRRVGLAVEFGKRFCLARSGPRARARAGVDLEPAEAFVHVGHETRLAIFAIIDDVDAERDLLLHDLPHGLAQPRGMFRLIQSAAVRLHKIEEVGRPRQAADVGGEDAIGAALHASPLRGSFPRRREPMNTNRTSSLGRWSWVPAFAGMTQESIEFYSCRLNHLLPPLRLAAHEG